MSPKKQNSVPAAVLVALLATLVGITAIAPQLLIWKQLHDLNQTYFLKQYSVFKDELKLYLALAHELYEGHGLSSETTLEPNTPTLQPPLPFYIASLAVRASRDNPNVAYLALTAIFAALLFLALFLLGRLALGVGLFQSLLMAAVLTVTPATTTPQSLFSWDVLTHKIFNYIIPFVRTPLAHYPGGEIIDPLISYPFFVLATVGLFLFYRKQNTITAILAGFLVGLMVHVYFFKWVYLVVWAGFLTAYFLLRHKKTNTKAHPHFIFIGLIIALFIPFLLKYLQFNALEASPEYTWRYSTFEYGRHLRTSTYSEYLLYGLMGLAVHKTFGKRNPHKHLVYLTALAAALTVWNLQVIIGFVPDPRHWFTTTAPVLLIMAFDMVCAQTNRLCHRHTQAPTLLAAILTAFVLTKGLANTVYFLSPPPRSIKQYHLETDLKNSWLWINKNLPPDAVMASPSFLTTLQLISFTTTRPFLPAFLTTHMPNRELEKRFIQTNKLFNIPESVFRDRITMNIPYNFESVLEIYGYTFVNQAAFTNKYSYLTPFDIPQKNVDYPPANQIAKLFNDYQKRSPDWVETDIDYAYLGPLEKQLGAALDIQDNRLTPIYKTSAASIYQIKH